jgi:hypothetical protein
MSNRHSCKTQLQLISMSQDTVTADLNVSMVLALDAVLGYQVDYDSEETDDAEGDGQGDKGVLPCRNTFCWVNACIQTYAH